MLITELKAEYTSLIKDIEKLRKKANKSSKKLLQEATNEYLTKYEDWVKAIVWIQYTPFFNDGEECTFSVNEPYLVGYTGEDEYDEEYEESSDFPLNESLESLEEELQEVIAYSKDPTEYVKNKPDPEWTGYGYNKINYYKPSYLTENQLRDKISLVKSFPENFVKDSKEILNLISSIDETIMKELFQDHSKIIVTKDAIEIQTYEHE